MIDPDDDDAYEEGDTTPAIAIAPPSTARGYRVPTAGPFALLPFPDQIKIPARGSIHPAIASVLTDIFQWPGNLTGHEYSTALRQAAAHILRGQEAEFFTALSRARTPSGFPTTHSRSAAQQAVESYSREQLAQLWTVARMGVSAPSLWRRLSDGSVAIRKLPTAAEQCDPLYQAYRWRGDDPLGEELTRHLWAAYADPRNSALHLNQTVKLAAQFDPDDQERAEALIAMTRGVLDSGDVDPIAYMVAISEGKPWAPNELQALRIFMGETAKLTPEQWARTRAPEISAGVKIAPIDAAEKAALAIVARAQLSAAEEEAAARIIRAQNEALTAQQERDAAGQALARARAGPPNTGGSLKKSYRRARKTLSKAESAVRHSVTRPFQQALSRVSHTVLPSAARDQLRRLDKTRKETGRRINRQFLRTVRDVATEYGPWLYIAAPFVGLVVGGWLSELAIAGTVAAIEIGYAHRQRQALERETDRIVAQLHAETLAAREETEKLRAELAELEAQRLAIVGQAQRESAQRLTSIAAAEKQTRRNNLALGILSALISIGIRATIKGGKRHA